MLAAVIGSSILSVVVILNSRGATRYHVGFPVYVRAAAGVSGAKLFIVVRASVAIIYFATQSFYGGMLASVALRAIFGSRWENIPNLLPLSAGITSKNLLAFFIFWFIQFPVMFIHPTILRHLFVVKSVATTAGLFGVLGWAVHMNGGNLGNFDFGRESLSGDALVWPMIQAINSVMAALCPIVVNQPDVARYATRPAQATWSQAVGILVSKVLVMFLSCATTSAASGVLGKSYWNVWDLYNAILTEYWGPGARAGMFFASAIMIVDYWILRRGNFHVPSLYTLAESSPYTYYKGWNLRAVVAWMSGVVFTVHGIAGNLDPDSVNQASKNMYKFGFLLSFFMGSLVYYVACLIWPVQVYPAGMDSETPMGFETMAASEGFFPGEGIETIRGVISAVEATDVSQNIKKGAGGESMGEKYAV
ncbi:allantoin transporter [Colletotrichum tofieldiae]|nr:allantoin transporter [Colletotrichum tofieldiae]GKT78453.1 allantoin transporter [Colletotrichum tofieldiae]